MSTAEPEFSRFCSRLFGRSRETETNWILVRETDSTNLMARRLVGRIRDEEGTLLRTAVLAWSQSSGRGRRGRQWSSSPGQGIYLSLIYPGVDGAMLRSLPFSAALVAVECVRRLMASPVRIKWPNDLMVRGRKLGGILIEAVSRSSKGDKVAATAIVGFGLNCFRPPEDMPVDRVTSLTGEGAREVEAVAIALDLTVRLDQIMDHPRPLDRVVEDYRHSSAHRIGDSLVCTYKDSTVKGVFAGFDDDGTLLLDCGDRLLELRSSEIIEG